jgi:hypothetical protein
MTIRLGELLIEQGVLTRDQVEAVLEAQRQKQRPFGVLAEELFDADPHDVERAWAEQYSRLSPAPDLDEGSFEREASVALTRRQAWQFRVLPIRFDGPELVLATTVEHLPKALKFASRCLTMPCMFVTLDSPELGRWLCARYPMTGMNPGSVEGDPFASLRQAG